MDEKEVLAWLGDHIEILNKESSRIREKMHALYSAKFELSSVKNTLECGKGLPMKDAICIGCDKAKPKYVETWNQGLGRGAPSFKLPGGGEIEFVRVDWDQRTCSQWERKVLGTACGCAGTRSCVCGYSQDTCWIQDASPCPFCGRCVDLKQSRIFKDTQEIIRGLKISNA
jgi:hypothetical protein